MFDIVTSVEKQKTKTGGSLTYIHSDSTFESGITKKAVLFILSVRKELNVPVLTRLPGNGVGQPSRVVHYTLCNITRI